MTKDDLRELDELEKAELAARIKHRKGSGRADIAERYREEWTYLREKLGRKLREHARTLIDNARFSKLELTCPAEWAQEWKEVSELRAEIAKLQKEREGLIAECSRLQFEATTNMQEGE